MPLRSVPEEFLKIRSSNKWLVAFYDYANFVFGGGAAVFSGTAAIQSQISSDKVVTGILAGIGALCGFVNTAFKFNSRYARQLNCILDMEQAFLKYQADTSIPDSWLADQVSKALDRIRENQ